MNNAKVIEAINMLIEGLESLRDAVGTEKNEEAAPVAKKAVAKKDVTKSVGKPAPVSNEDESDADGETYTRAELEGMKYNDFKKTAAKLGVDCKGTREDIMKRIEALGVIVDGEGDAEAPVKKADSKKTVAKSGKSLAKKEDAKSGKDEFDEQAEEIAKDTSAEDIIAALKDVGVKATKLNYRKELAKALREGLIDLEEDGDEDSDVESGADDGDSEFSADSYFQDYDLSESNIPDEMTEERAAAVQEKVASILVSVESGDLKSDDIIDYLQNNASQEELDLLGDDYTEDDVLALYIEVAKHFIDNDGEEHEPGEPYEIGDKNFCCGHELKYDKKTKQYICEHCTTSYEAD